MNSIEFRSHQSTAIEIMKSHDSGIICLPTGSGKTLIGIGDVMNEFDTANEVRTICVVSPKILLACQLCSEYLEHLENKVKVLHVHSGKVSHYNTTNSKNISDWVRIHSNSHKLIFSTYHSLKKIIESNIKIHTYMMDEAHNSVKRSFYDHVAAAKETSDRCYFFTATPKVSNVATKPGMNRTETYGNIIYNLPAPELAKSGYILKPRVIAKKLETSENIPQRDFEFIQKILEEENLNKLLIAVKSTKSMMQLFSETALKIYLSQNQYSLLHITSQHGAFIDDKKVSRDKFFRILNTWGKEKDRKFVVMNHSILGEGINVNCLDAVCFMRNLDVISLLQNTGRALRLDPSDIEGIRNGTVIPGNFDTYLKPEGLVILPVYNHKTETIQQNVETIMNSVFERGELVCSEIVK